MRIFDKAVAHAVPLIPHVIVKRISRRYIAGATLEDALAVIERLNASGFAVTLDVLGETAVTPTEADSMAESYLSAIDGLGAHALDVELSIRPTALHLLADRQACETRLRRILDRATSHGIDACLDMEDTRCTQLELDLLGRVKTQHRRLGIAVQAYLERTYSDLDDLLKTQGRVRVCKGIYAEDDADLVDDAALDRKAINRHFANHVLRCFKAGVFTSVATHDEALIEDIVTLIKQNSIAPTSLEFQVLSGVCGPIRDRLRDMGFPVRVYVPFGADWYGYSVRRLKENPRVAGYVLRSMFSA